MDSCLIALFIFVIIFLFLLLVAYYLFYFCYFYVSHIRNSFLKKYPILFVLFFIFFIFSFSCSDDEDVVKKRGPDGTVGRDLVVM